MANSRAANWLVFSPPLTGLRFLYRLSQAIGVAIDGVNYEQLPALFIGKRLEVIVAHSARDGIPELVVRTMRPLSVAE